MRLGYPDTLEGTGLWNRRAIVSMMSLCYIRWRLEAACRKDPRSVVYFS